VTNHSSQLPQSPQEVKTLPYPVERDSHFRVMTIGASPRYTHYLFRFPAKFHAPIVKWTLDHFAPKNGLVLDPFNGSGTLQVEALVGEYNSIGLDIDLVATYIARAKTTPIAPDKLQNVLQMILTRIAPLRRSTADYERMMFSDLPDAEFDAARMRVEIPTIPDIEHWFRRYALIDLANLRQVIESVSTSSEIQRFFLAVFAGIIRRCSNADPEPVSGLEYTKEMKRRDQLGRYIDPFAVFEERALLEITGMGQLWESTVIRPNARAIVHHGDVLNLVNELEEVRGEYGVEQPVNTVITSPPYCSAVDYHTRHKLEAYWLRLINNQEEYLQWYRRYIGRRRVLISERNGLSRFGVNELDTLIERMGETDKKPAFRLHDYFAKIQMSLEQIAQVLSPEGTFIMFIGNSASSGYRIDTHLFIRELASRYFELRTEFSYELRNRYMRYTRHNGADIDTEWVMVFKRP
jgi:DNA modification methylase